MKARKVEGLEPGVPLRTNAALIVRTRVEEVRSFADDALDPNAAEAQHNMRIAAKRLRYVLEITAFCFRPEAEEARSAAEELQSVLGDIHDCDVMLSQVEGVDSLATLCQARRELLFHRFCDLWRGRLDSALGALERVLP